VPHSRIEQAGAVVFRRKSRGIRFLVISSRRTSGRWLFPKGHVDEGETASEAALREASEEAGVAGAVIKRLSPALEYRYRHEHYRVRYFLVEWTGDTAAEEDRQCLWLTPEQAQATLSDASARKLVEVALEAIERNEDRSRSARRPA
jgi:8-oxo-dGTP pyrophosphatase MutT (NUDIX family)